MKRHSKHKKHTAYNDDDPYFATNPHPFNDFNSYGSPTIIGPRDKPNSRPLSMSTNPGATEAKPRPFVQAYNPSTNPSQQGQQYAGYDRTHSPPVDPSRGGGYGPSQGSNQYYHDYQPNQPQQQDGLSNNYPQYPATHDGYYSQQVEPMIPIMTSNIGTTGLRNNNNTVNSNTGRNVPDEVDYPRYVPDEIDDQPPHTNTASD